MDVSSTTKRFHNRVLMLGFGSIGRATLPLIFRHLQLEPSQISIIDKACDGREIAQALDITIQQETITKETYATLIGNQLNAGDILLNLSVDISSVDLIKLCQEKRVLYLDTCTEPWLGGYTDITLPPSSRTNYALRESVLKLKNESKTTAVITHGANPGLVSHFIKQALLNIAQDNELNITVPSNSLEWAMLSLRLGIKAIHIAERDTQITNRNKQPGEFVNTWSVDGFMSEAVQPAELGWGTHEKHWPHDGNQHTTGSQCSIYLGRSGASTQVRTWTPCQGAAHGFLIPHAESISIANYLTVKKDNEVTYRPTVHYAYVPCPDAVLSMYEYAENEWGKNQIARLILNDITDGTDELGVLLMGNIKGAYWYGSQLSIQEARSLVPHNNATSLQVAAAVISGMLWAIEHPDRGIVEAEELDYQYIMNVCRPYLGTIAGYYTNWTPIKNRSTLFLETLDLTDPWQFLNTRVN